MKKTMKNKICLLGALLLLLTFGSCQKDSDTLIRYDYNDVLAFAAADTSFAAKYEVFWNGMNQNYALWDYEMEHGLDWDAEYEKFHPLFEALDKQKVVSDEEVQKLMEQMVAPLHDGHMVVSFLNHRTSQFVSVDPQTLRNASRADYISDNDLPAFTERWAALAAVNKSDVLESYFGSTHLKTAFSHVLKGGSTRQWISAEIERLGKKTTPTEKEVEKLAGLKQLMSALDAIFLTYGGVQLVNAYNQLVLSFSYLEVPGLEEISPEFAENGLRVSYALLKGNIVYLYLSAFSLSNYLLPSYYNRMGLKGSNDVMGKSIETAWLMWFSKIQELHKAGTLGGVIIDLRGNGGGMLNDYQFVIGALLPSGGFTTNLLRYKRGTARLDYSPLMPQVMPTLPSEHAVVTEPIVVLGDCNSVSMAEVTARSCKLIPNACFIGKSTWGALCGLNENPYFSVNYSGHIGVRRQTSVYVYTPMMASFSMDGKQLEGVGIEPDIEVDLDTKLFNANTSDTQLERALQYIRTGN